jgi:hypothetical protein
MWWRTAGCFGAALALAVAVPLAPASATGSDSKKGDSAGTATRAEWWLTKDNTGTLNLDKAGTAAKIPGTGPVVVSVGDSYISGEAGRWAGNPRRTVWGEYPDALGPDAYLDYKGQEALPRCHRSESAEIHFGQGTTSVNLACSGATTTGPADADPFKPGIDFTDATLSKGRVLGQATMLRNLAQSNKGRIKTVVLSIGGNDFMFAGIVAACVKTYLAAGTPCSRDPEVTDLFSQTNIADVQAAISGAIANVEEAMSLAKYTPDQWTLLVQTYPSPIASSKTIGYKQNYDRQWVGGCGFYDTDLDWANDTALYTINTTVKSAINDQKAAGATNIKVLDLSKALMGHRLCEQNTQFVGPLSWGVIKGYTWSPVKNWKQSNAADLSEWVNQIRVANPGPFYQQESLHPNYWGQLAYQSCLRQAYQQDGTVRGGTCVYAGAGLKDGRPQMELDTTTGWDQDLVLPTLARHSAGAPGISRQLVAEKQGATVLVDWRRPKDNDPVRAYFYRLREHGHAWGPWLDLGQATDVRLAGLDNRQHTVAVVAQNEDGTGGLARQSFRTHG